MKIGVIGLGAVGGTIHHALQFYHEEVIGYDKYKPSNSFREVLATEAIFIAVPTTLKDGRLDCSIIADLLTQLEKNEYKGIVVLKSTLALNFVDTIANYDLRIVYCPEFLHERKSLQDFVKPKILVIAGENADIDVIVHDVFYWLADTPVFRVNSYTAVLTKLVMNSFACTKISFANEIGRICKAYNVDPTVVMNIVVTEGRAAREYTDPTKGPFDGKCLPKDLTELINSSNDHILLKAVKEVNEVMKRVCEPSK